MRKLQLLWTALMVVAALSALTAVSASAEATLLAEWLIAAKPVLVLTSVMQTIIGLWLEDLNNDSTAFCTSVVYDGSVGASGEWEITAVLNLAGEEVTLTSPLLCERPSGTNCEASTTDIELAPDGLPWHGLVYLDESGLFLQTVTTTGEFVASCLELGIKITDTCTFTGGTLEVTNGVEGAMIGKEDEEMLPDGNCSVGGSKESTLLWGSNIIRNLTNEIVTISSEP
jgi:hypothetical protein